jgi:ABC-2 type transport system permease protein
MRALLAIAGREYASLFRIPLGWVVVALFVCLSSVFFVGRAIVPGSPATMREFFAVWWGLLLFLAPSISMRLVSEEHRSGTIETALTAPIPEGVLVIGKYAAGVAFLVTMLVPTLVFVGVLEWLSRPDYGPVLSGYLGLVLLGSLYLAVGTLASSMTASQTLAFLGTLFTLLLLDLLPSRIAPQMPTGVAKVLLSISPSTRAADFYRGLIDTSNIVYFFAMSMWFLALASVSLQSRRWR